MSTRKRRKARAPGERDRKRPPHPRISVARPSKAVRVSERRLRRLIEFVCQAERRTIAAVDLAVVGSARMSTLHRRYLGRRGATDVLSFDLSEPGRSRRGRRAPAGPRPVVAQIVVCADLAAGEARRRGHSARRELMLYVVHGLLHLTGYGDSSARRAARMHAREDELLTAFGEGPAYG